MKIFKNNQRLLYILSCILVTLFLYGCKEKKLGASVFDGLPESTFLTEMKTSLENHVPLAIAFTAEWCPHCRKYKPIFNEVKDLYKGKVTFINIDVDDPEGSPISNRFQVRGIPTTGFVRADGSVYTVEVGEINREDLIKTADELILSKKKKKEDPIAPFPIDLNKEETSPQEQPAVKKEAKPEEVKPQETKPEEIKPEEAPPVQEEPSLEVPEVPSGEIKLESPPPSPLEGAPGEKIQLPEPDESGQNNDLKDDEAPAEEESPPEQTN